MNSNNEDVAYPISYEFDVRHGSFSTEELKKYGRGGAEAVFFAPCVKGEDGELVPVFFSAKGDKPKTPLTNKELYSIWLELGKKMVYDSAVNGEFLIALTEMTAVVKSLDIAGVLQDVLAKVKDVADGKGEDECQ